MSKEFVKHLSELYKLSEDETNAILNPNPDSLRKIPTKKLVAIYGDIIEKAFEKLEDSCYEYYTYYDEYGQEISDYDLDEECLKRQLPVKIENLINYLSDDLKSLEKAIRDVLMSNPGGKKKLERLIASKKASIDKRIKIMLKEIEYGYELADMDYLKINIDTNNTRFVNFNKIDIKEYLNHMLKFFKDKYEPEIVALIKTTMGIDLEIISDYKGIAESVLRELEKELNVSIIASKDGEEEISTDNDFNKYRHIVSVMVKERLWRELKESTHIEEISVVDFTNIDDGEIDEFTAWVVWKPRKSRETTAKTVG
jgi:hypothetical protein